MKNGGDLKVLQGSGYEVLFGVRREIEVFKKSSQIKCSSKVVRVGYV